MRFIGALTPRRTRWARCRPVRILAGTSSGRFTPETLASYVVQRGVGVSIALVYVIESVLRDDSGTTWRLKRT